MAYNFGGGSSGLANARLRQNVASSPRVGPALARWFEPRYASWKADRRSEDIYSRAQGDGPSDFSNNLEVVIEDAARLALNRVAGYEG